MIITNQTSSSFKPFNIAWLFPHDDLARDPSNRLRRCQLSSYLNRLPSVESVNFFNYMTAAHLRTSLLSYDVVVLFSINEFDRDLLLFLKEKGKTIIFDHSERIFGLGHEDEIMQNVSAITCCSTSLARDTENYLMNKGYSKPIFVIRDPIEDSVLSLPCPVTQADENIALVMGMGANVQYVLPTLEGICREAGYKMLLLTEAGFTHPYHRVEIWTPATWISHAQECSVALCYHDWGQFPAKGNVKVTAPMSVGLPVVAVPMESYREAITDAYDGYICGKDMDWVTSLDVLKDKGLHTMMGLRARQKVLANYSTGEIVLDYLAVVNYFKES